MTGRPAGVNPVGAWGGSGYRAGMTTHDEKSPAGSDDGADGMTDEQKRHDQLTAAPDATEADAAPRIEVSEHDGNARIDVAPDAPVRPGPGPGAPAPDETSDGSRS